MENHHQIDVATLDAPHRRALEEVIGSQLVDSQRLIIRVMEVPMPATSTPRDTQSLADWTGIYDGLNDDEIETIDEVIKTRAHLTRDFPENG
ncbi:MAG: hypothetical protein ACKVT0_20670 [Planctomycetaceae bacterium]